MRQVKFCILQEINCKVIFRNVFYPLIGKLIYRFVERSGRSENLFVIAFVHSASHNCSKYFAHYRDFLTLEC